MSTFGEKSDGPRRYSYYGVSGFFSVPGGRNWYMMQDSGMQMWASPNALTRNADGTVSGSPKYACDLNADGTLVFIDCLANRNQNIDSPGHDRLSPTN